MSTSRRTHTSVQGRAGSEQVLWKAALAVFAASALPTVSAARDCWVDSYGSRHCRLSVGTRIAIAVAVAVACILVIIGLFIARRRRVMRANQAYVAAQQHQQANHPYGNQYQYGNTPYNPTYDPMYAAQYQQYPPQGQSYYNAQAPQDGYAPPEVPPPNYQEYNPPRSPPPTMKA
ncbi:hypothetical protein ACEPAF_5391 [Sanghuangporus sanghuang]